MSTPESSPGPPLSKWIRCEVRSASTSSPGRVCTLTAISLHMVPEGRKTAASLPRRSATISWSRFTVGSSPFCSSPTSASHMKRRMSGVGLVRVSLKRSITMEPPLVLSSVSHALGAVAGPPPRCDSTSGMRILVVEDERKVAAFVRQGLVEEGHVVEVAPDGEAALDAVAEGPPYDLIVLDVMLPRRDGLSVLKALRASRMQAPVLLLTARDGVADKVAGLDAGADDYLAKPFAFEELLARVRALLRRGARAPAGGPLHGSRHASRHAGQAPHHAHRARVRAARVLPAQYRPRAHAAHDHPARLGHGLRPRKQYRGRVRGLPAPQDRRGR